MTAQNDSRRQKIIQIIRSSGVYLLSFFVFTGIYIQKEYSSNSNILTISTAIAQTDSNNVQARQKKVTSPSKPEKTKTEKKTKSKTAKKSTRSPAHFPLPTTEADFIKTQPTGESPKEPVQTDKKPAPQKESPKEPVQTDKKPAPQKESPKSSAEKPKAVKKPEQKPADSTVVPIKKPQKEPELKKTPAGISSKRIPSHTAVDTAAPLPGDSTIIDRSASPDSLAKMAGDTMETVDSVMVEEESAEPDTAYISALIVLPIHLDVLTTSVHKLVGMVFGPYSSLVTNDSFEWSSSIDGFLSRGKELAVVHLTPGVHKLKLSVKNNTGELTADSIFCVVTDQYIDTPPEVINSPPLSGSTESFFGEIIIGMKLNEEGGVAQVQLLNNTTHNDSLAEYYVDRTRKMSYSPAYEGEVRRSSWIAHSLYFDGVEAPDEIIAAAPEILLAIRREEVDFLRSQGAGAIGEGGAAISYKRKVSENSQKVLTTLFPTRLLPIPLRLSKNKKALSGEIAAVIKINRMGLVTAILILENTTHESWIEENFVRIMYESVFEPMYDPAGSNERIIQSVFKIQGELLIPQDVGDEEAWKARYQYRFPLLESGEEPEFGREPKARIAYGYFRLLIPILENGRAKHIKEIEININEGDVAKHAKKTYEKNIYSPALVNGKPRRCYLSPVFSFENFENTYYLRALRPYNNAYYYLLHREYKKAVSNFEKVGRRDLTSDFIGMYSQFVYCAEQIDKYDKVFKAYEEGIRKFASMQNLFSLDRLAIEYNNLQKAYVSNTPFHTIMFGGNSNLYELSTFLPANSQAQIKGKEANTIQDAKFPEDVQKSGAEGVLDVVVMINNNSMVKDVGIQKSFGSIKCEEEALKKAKRQDYETAKIGSDPVTSWISIQVPFRYSSPILQISSNEMPLQKVPRPDSLYIKPGLPTVFYEGPNRFSKANDETTGFIRTALKINRFGRITDILMLDNTISKDKKRAEEDLIKLLTQTLFNPATVSQDSLYEVVYIATFIIKEKQFALPDDNRMILFVDKYPIIFPKLIEGSEPSFETEKDVHEAFGSFSFAYTITPEGNVKNIKSIYKDINKGKLADAAKKAIESHIYTGGKFGDSLKTAYKIADFGFKALDYDKQVKLIEIYNEGYKKHIKDDWSGAAGKFKEVIKKDRIGDFFTLLPQMLLCYRKAGTIHEGYELFNDILKRFSIMQDTLYFSLARQYVSLRFNAATGKDFYAVLTDSSTPKALFELTEPHKGSSLLSDLESLWQHVEYPKKDRDKTRYGDVDVMILINEKGEKKSIEFLHSLGDDDYDKRAKKVIENNATFSTAQYYGQPVPFWCHVPIKFEKPIYIEEMIPWWNEPDAETAPVDTLISPDSLEIAAVGGDSVAYTDSTVRIDAVQKSIAPADTVAAIYNKFDISSHNTKSGKISHNLEESNQNNTQRNIRIQNSEVRSKKSE